jgi:DNA-directed RNA polymerase specialized sigma24 family protein
VIRLKHFEGRTFREIGEVLEIPANTAKTHYYRGLEWLRRRLRTLREGSER